jgi:hypothetical protein
LTAILNRDLAAHSGQLTFNGQSLQKSLAPRPKHWLRLSRPPTTPKRRRSFMLSILHGPLVWRLSRKRHGAMQAWHARRSGAFAEAYPQNMRAASATVILKSFGGPNDPN